MSICLLKMASELAQFGLQASRCVRVTLVQELKYRETGRRPIDLSDLDDRDAVAMLVGNNTI